MIRPEVVAEKINAPNHKNARENNDRSPGRRHLLLLQERKIEVVLHLRERAEKVAPNLRRDDKDEEIQAPDHHHPLNQAGEMKSESARSNDEKKKKSVKRKERNVNRNAN